MVQGLGPGRVPFRVFFFYEWPYCIGDLKNAPNGENYPSTNVGQLLAYVSTETTPSQHASVQEPTPWPDAKRGQTSQQAYNFLTRRCFRGSATPGFHSVSGASLRYEEQGGKIRSVNLQTPASFPHTAEGEGGGPD